MPTFIDESGDTGPIESGGKPYFRLAAVWMPSLDDVERFRENVGKLRYQLGLKKDYEFKFAETHPHPDRRRAFYDTAMTQEFRFAVSLIDKMDAYWREASRFEQHRACATELAALLRPVYYRAQERTASPLRESIIVDDNSDGAFLAIIKKQFRGLRPSKPGASSLIGRVAFRSSKADAMLQLIDMICGAVGSLADGDDRSWYDLIAQRDVEIRESI